MTPAARSILIFGVYIVLLGLILATVPNLLLEAFGFAEAREVWVRVLGLVVFVLGCYYIQAARQEVTAFFRCTVWGRTLILVGLTLLVLAGHAPSQLILFGAIDAAGAAWTARALRSSEPRPDSLSSEREAGA